MKQIIGVFEKIEMPLILFIYLCMHSFFFFNFYIFLYVLRHNIFYSNSSDYNHRLFEYDKSIHTYECIYVCSLFAFSHFLVVFSHNSTNPRLSETGTYLYLLIL